MVDSLFIPRPRDKTNHPDSCRDKAVKKLTAVTEYLLPFINGPPRLKFTDWFLAAHLLNAKRYDKRSPQILHLPQSANFFKAEDVSCSRIFIFQR